MGKFLGAALESIIARTLPDFELLVVDDDSSDEHRFSRKGISHKFTNEITRRRLNFYFLARGF